MELQGTVTDADISQDGKLNVAARALFAKKARHVTAIDISKVTTVANHFLICSGTSSTHIKALADAVEDALDQAGISAFRRNGHGSARWILLDYSELVVHIFHEDDRNFYGLERLWQDGDFLALQETE